MSQPHASPFEALQRTFHEPKRLAIVSALCSAPPDGLTFNELKAACDLTDGNLSRHLKTLEEDLVVRVTKTFVGVKPRTTVFLTDAGRARFMEYLQALEAVLRQAAKSLEETPAQATARRRRSLLADGLGPQPAQA